MIADRSGSPIVAAHTPGADKTQFDAAPFLHLLQRFCNGSLSASSFRSSFLQRWTQEHYEIKNKAPLRQQRSSQLPNKGDEIVIDRVHSVAYFYEPDSEADPDLHVDEQLLRTEAMLALEQLTPLLH